MVLLCFVWFLICCLVLCFGRLGLGVCCTGLGCLNLISCGLWDMVVWVVLDFDVGWMYLLLMLRISLT